MQEGDSSVEDDSDLQTSADQEQSSTPPVVVAEEEATAEQHVQALTSRLEQGQLQTSKTQSPMRKRKREEFPASSMCLVCVLHVNLYGYAGLPSCTFKMCPLYWYPLV